MIALPDSLCEGPFFYTPIEKKHQDAWFYAILAL